MPGPASSSCRFLPLLSFSGGGGSGEWLVRCVVCGVCRVWCVSCVLWERTCADGEVGLAEPHELERPLVLRPVEHVSPVVATWLMAKVVESGQCETAAATTHETRQRTDAEFGEHGGHEDVVEEEDVELLHAVAQVGVS